MNQLKKLRLRFQDYFRHYSQAHHYYDGPYHGGQSFYSYYLDDEGMRVFDGPFRYQLSSISPYGKAFRNEAEGSFLNGLKDGKWHYLFKSDTHRMKLTVDYVKGNIDGYLYYEEYNANMVQNKASKTKISFRSSKRRLIGEVVGLFQGHKFKARLDAEGLPHDKWSTAVNDKEHGDWEAVEVWNHGHLEKAERRLFTYGRKEAITPYMCQKLNQMIDEINHSMLCIVKHGSLGGLSYIPVA